MTDIDIMVEKQAKKWSTSRGFLNLHESRCRQGYRRSMKVYERRLAKMFQTTTLSQQVAMIVKRTVARAHELESAGPRQ